MGNRPGAGGVPGLSRTLVDMDVAGITYNDTYYIKKEAANELRVHFHELVHVLQWRELAPQGFIERYIREIQYFGYNNAPLEKMAYALDGLCLRWTLPKQGTASQR